ncbi:MAG: hypothetical protein ABIG28_00625 [archaeon]
MAKKRKSGNALGSWSFLIGVVLAVIFGLLGPLNMNITYILMVLGVIIGLLNIADEEVTPFLFAGAILVIVSSFGQNVMSNVAFLSRVLNALIILFVPATIIVALKSVFGMARR